jgi:hypothetical protein
LGLNERQQEELRDVRKNNPEKAVASLILTIPRSTPIKCLGSLVSKKVWLNKVSCYAQVDIDQFNTTLNDMIRSSNVLSELQKLANASKQFLDINTLNETLVQLYSLLEKPVLSRESDVKLQEFTIFNVAFKLMQQHCARDRLQQTKAMSEGQLTIAVVDPLFSEFFFPTFARSYDVINPVLKSTSARVQRQKKNNRANRKADFLVTGSVETLIGEIKSGTSGFGDNLVRRDIMKMKKASRDAWVAHAKVGYHKSYRVYGVWFGQILMPDCTARGCHGATRRFAFVSVTSTCRKESRLEATWVVWCTPSPRRWH